MLDTLAGAARISTPVRRPRWLVALTELTDVTTYAGGIGRTYAALLPALVSLGIDVDVVLLGTDDVGARNTADLPYTLVDNSRQLGLPLVGPLARAVRVRRAVARGSYDAVLLPEWEGLGALLPRSTPLVTNLSTSLELIADVSAARPSVRSPRKLVSYLLQVALETRQIARSRGLIGISRVIVDWNRTHLRVVPRADVVRNCVDIAAVQAAVVRAPRPSEWPAGRTVVFLGRLEERKGIRVALEAFNQLGVAQPEVQLVLIGGLGDPAKELTRDGILDAVLPELRDRVHILGHLSGDRLYGAVKSADLVMCPSLWEGFGNVGLEVKAAGVPFVATSGSGFDEFCTSGVDCMLVPPGDAAALAAACTLVLSDGALRSCLVAAGLASVDAFTPEAVAHDFVTSVTSLLERTI